VEPLETLPSGATSALEGDRFQHPNIRVPLGASLTWEFRDAEFHNVVLANGPWSAGAPRNRYRRPDSYTTTFPLPGTYQLFCQLHPLTMHQQVQVSAAP
jgi:plastocyanin